MAAAFAHAGLRGAGLTAVLLASVAVSVMVVAGMRPIRRRPVAFLCGGGSTLSIVGLTGLTVALDYFAWPGWVVAAGLLLVAGPVLTWYGVRAADGFPPEPEPVDGDRELLGGPAGRDGPATAIIDVIVKLSGQIGVEVAAQGLAAAADLDEARAAGCRYGQGPLFSQPLPPEHLEAYLDAVRSAPPSPRS